MCLLENVELKISKRNAGMTGVTYTFPRAWITDCANIWIVDIKDLDCGALGHSVSRILKNCLHIPYRIIFWMVFNSPACRGKQQVRLLYLPHLYVCKPEQQQRSPRSAVQTVQSQTTKNILTYFIS